MSIELVFIHGWGFDARFWDVVSTLLPQFRQKRVDLGFFGQPTPLDEKATGLRILVGHSLGFVHGIAHMKNWQGWIAINSFPRFVKTDTLPGCTSAVELRDIQKRLRSDPTAALQGFYQHVKAPQQTGTPDASRLLEGLDELRDRDIEKTLNDLTIPGLALCGVKDVLVPVETSESLGRLARHGGLKMHKKAGHILPLTEPVWCAEAIAEFTHMYFD